jgi:hypothetical protein
MHPPSYEVILAATGSTFWFDKVTTEHRNKNQEMTMTLHRKILWLLPKVSFQG